MKKLLILTLGILFLAGGLGFAQSLTPFFEIENVGVDANPTLDAGLVLSGDWAESWSMDLGFAYSDPNILILDDPWMLDFNADLYFDETAIVNTTGVLKYGCAFFFTQSVTFEFVGELKDLVPTERTTGLMLEGYVGPLSLWGGASFPWETSPSFVPVLGIRVEQEFDL